MKIFENRGLGKAEQTFIENVFLGVLEFVLAEGVDNALSYLSDLTENDVIVFPHIRDALKGKGLLN